MFDGILGLMKPGGADVPKLWGSLLRITVVSTTGASVWTKGPGTRKALIFAIGGGASGGSTDTAAVSGAGGGASGAVALKLLDVTSISGLSLSVGLGGTAPASGGNPGLAGGATTVKAMDGNTSTINLVANGGAAGAGPSGGPTGGAAAGATGGDVNINGYGGANGVVVGSGNGGNTPFGWGSGGVVSGGDSNGNGGTGLGAGGSGACTTGVGNRSGGTGAAGGVVIFEFA